MNNRYVLIDSCLRPRQQMLEKFSRIGYFIIRAVVGELVCANHKGQQLKRLTDQNVIITGASSGFGRAIALACAAEGAHVALVARRETELQAVAEQAQTAGARTVVCAADVRDEAAVLAAVETTRQKLGPIDILVNNAGTNVTQRSITDTGSDQWRYLLDVNLTSAFLFTKAVLPEMKARRSGLIINLSSRAGLRPSLPAGVAYSASKMGMDALTQVTNQEGNPFAVRACLICPGTANTPLLDLRPAPPPQPEREHMLQVEDIAAAVIFVATLPPRAHVDLVSIKPTQPSH